MRREWEPEDLVACWTLAEQDERELVAYKRGATRLGFALMLKFFEIEARFPRHVGEYPPAAVPTWPGRSMSTRASWPATSGSAAPRSSIVLRSVVRRVRRYYRAV